MFSSSGSELLVCDPFLQLQLLLQYSYHSHEDLGSVLSSCLLSLSGRGVVCCFWPWSIPPFFVGFL